MAILHADNFSIYGTNTGLMLNGVYANVQAAELRTDPDGISGGRVLSKGTPFQNTTELYRYPLQTGARPVVGVAFRVWWPNLPINNDARTSLAAMRSIGNIALANLCTLSNGALRVRVITGEDAFTDYDTDVPVLAANGWYHIEFRYQHIGTTASFEVRVEGQTVIEEITVPALNFDIGQVASASSNIAGNQGYSLKDLVIWDTSGTYNTDFLGSVIVTNLTPTSDVALNWTPSVGTTGFAILDNIPPNDGQFLSAPFDPAPAGPYTGTLSDLPTETTSVRALLTFVRAAKSDGGDGSMQVGLVSGGATILGADRPITVAQTYWRDVFEQDPATSAPWLPSAANAAILQINRTT